MLLRLRRRATPVLAVLTLAVGSTEPVAAAVPTGTVVLTMLGEGGSLVGHGTAAFTSAGPLEVHRNDTLGYDLLQVVAGDEPGTRLTLAAASNRPRLAVGRYTTTDVVHPDVAMFELTTGSRGCADAGSFDVLAVSRDAEGHLASLALDYSTTCAGDPAPVRGSLRWNSDVPWVHTAVAPLRLPDTAPGLTARGTVTLTNAGTRPQTYGATTWQPVAEPEPGQPPVVIVADGCSGVTLQPGRGCDVRLSISSDGRNATDGFLRTPDGTARGAAYTPVSMRAVPAPRAVTLTASARRGGIELFTDFPHPSYRILRATAGGAETEVARDAPLPWTDTAVAVGTTYTYRVVPASGGLTGPPSSAASNGPLPAPVGHAGTFVAIQPTRVLDTREGTGARKGPVGEGETVLFRPSSGGQVPATGVLAVLLNVTGTQPTQATHVRVWPAGDALPDTSSLNLAPGQSRPNQVVVPVGADGMVALFNNSGRTHLVVDVQGFYSDVEGPEGGEFHLVPPSRALDTRLQSSPLGAGEDVWVPLDLADTNGTRVAAVDVNLTVTQPTAAGHLTAWSGEDPAPGVSNVNFEPGQTVANHAVVPVSYDDQGFPGIVVRNSGGLTHLVVDVQGWYDRHPVSGLRFAPTTTSRVADTRTGGTPAQAGQTIVVPAGSLPPGAAHAVNVTATQPGGPGHLTVWSGVGVLPFTSSVNYVPGEDAPAYASPRARPDGSFSVTVQVAGVHVVVDHLGFFY